MADPTFTLLPADDPQSTPDQALSAAVAGATATPPGLTPVPATAPAPMGNSWEFDWQAGQFTRAGSAPLSTVGEFGGLEAWCLMAIHAARYGQACFSDAFGMEEPDDIIGTLVQGEALADWQSHLIDALMVHDRITSVTNFDMTWDPTTGILTINNFDVITDDDSTLTISDVTLEAGGTQ